MNNNQFGTNSTNNQMNSNNFNQSQQTTNFGQNQNSQSNNFVQNQNHDMNAFNEQPMPNNTSKSKNNTILIIGIIVIVVIVGAVLLFSGVFSGNSKNASTYVQDAKSIINGANSLVDSDNISSVLGSSGNKYAPICTYNNENNESTITLNSIINEGYFSNNNNINYDLNSSFVKVKAVIKNNSCKYEYYIYLTDGNYSIGTPSNPILESDITNKSVKK